jgi:anthranilate phosphoribosyltransferase
MPVRREIGCRTLFNLLGPLLNPARPTHQLLGVGIPGFAPRMAKALALTGCVAGLRGPRRGRIRRTDALRGKPVVWVHDGWLREEELDPQALGLARHNPEDVTVTGKEAAVAVLRELLEGGGPQAMRDMLVLNVAVCLFLLDAAPGAPGTMAEAVEQARAAVAAGAGRALLHA